MFAPDFYHKKYVNEKKLNCSPLISFKTMTGLKHKHTEAEVQL